MHAWLFQLRHALPVRHAGGALHQQKRLTLDRSHDVMIHRRIYCNIKIRFLMPGRIIVPGYDVYGIFELKVVQAIVVVHKIRSGWQLWIKGFDHGDFMLHKI
ncbi:hypothetical protein D3C73_921930 [compost metagenome]